MSLLTIQEALNEINGSTGLTQQEAANELAVAVAAVASSGALTLTNTTTDNTISVDQNGSVGTDVATDGAVHIENTGNSGIGLGVYSNIGATADAPLVSIFADNTAFDQNVLNIKNDGTQKALYVENTVAPANNTAAIEFKQTAAMTNAGNVFFQVQSVVADGVDSTPLVRFMGNSNTWEGTVLNVTQEGNGYGINIIHNDTGTKGSLFIDRNGNNAAAIPAIIIDVTNAGVGGAEAFRFNGSEIISASVGGTQDKKVQVNVAGTTYYIPLHTA